MKRLRGKSSKKREIGGESESGVEKSDFFEMGSFGCSCEDNSRKRDSGASVSSRDVETCRRWEEIIGFGVEENSRSSGSPFRFSLDCSSPRKPDFSSPARSPRRSDKQVCVLVLYLFVLP